MEENKEENKKEETKEEKKDKKAKKEKKPKIKFSEIDITTASDDDIIQSGIRDNVKSDKICYAIMALIVVLMIIPPALRFFIPKPITQIEAEIVYVDLTCYRTIARDGYELSSKIESKYRDGEAQTSRIEHTYKKTAEDAPDEYSFVEINELNDVDKSLKGFKAEEKSNQYIFDINFENNPELANNEVLGNYAFAYGIEINYLSGQNFYCDTKSETVEELIYVENRKKVE